MAPYTQRLICLATIVSLLVLGWLLLLLGDTDWQRRSFAGLLQGTQFGQTALIAAWLAVGPFPLARRFALASIWFAAVVLAVGLNRNLVAEMYEYNLVLTCALISLCQVMLIIIPLSGVSAYFGWCFVWGEDNSAARRPDRQIGIREALVLTAAVATVLGAARFQYGDLRDVKIKWDYAASCAFFTTVSVVVGVPAIVSNFSDRHWSWPLIGGIILSALVMVLETVSLQFVFGTGALPLDAYLFTFLVNATECAWIFAVLTLLKLGGFRFLSSCSRSSASTVKA